MKRRTFVVATGAVATNIALPRVVTAQANTSSNARGPVLEKLVREFAKGAPVTEGRVKLAIAPLVDNGNSVPVEVSVESPMRADDYVARIAIFNEKNPQHDVAVFTLTPACGRARVTTRIRLAMSQQLVAVAEMQDGRCYAHTVDVLVTLASCLEEE
jgi:sulfur-oxidizing protein SoxY